MTRNQICIYRADATMHYAATGERQPCSQHEHMGRQKANELVQAGIVRRLDRQQTIVLYIAEPRWLPKKSGQHGPITLQLVQ